jgi:hypothetical protein
MQGTERSGNKVKLLRIIWLPVAGLVLVMGGFVYDVLFAGIPYQDPTPAMQSRWEFHRSAASIVQAIGAFSLLAGIVAIPLLRKRVKDSREVGG